jgi:hypothetical protein
MATLAERYWGELRPSAAGRLDAGVPADGEGRRGRRPRRSAGSAARRVLLRRSR